MADIDVDSMLEKQEKKEKQEKTKKTAVTAAIIAGSLAVVAAIAVVTFIIVRGEPAPDYFPAAGRKLVYNVKGGSPQLWQVEQSSAGIYGYDCRVMDKMDKGTYITRREYYAIDAKKGIAMLAYSENSASPVKDIFEIMPYWLRTGRVFNAAIYQGTVVKGTVIGRESISTPAGEFETFRVDYKSDKMDKTVWYAKGIGVVMEKDNISAAQTGLISAGD